MYVACTCMYMLYEISLCCVIEFCAGSLQWMGACWVFRYKISQTCLMLRKGITSTAAVMKTTAMIVSCLWNLHPWICVHLSVKHILWYISWTVQVWHALLLRPSIFQITVCLLLVHFFSGSLLVSLQWIIK